ncbi:hypothetical protein Tco_1140185, partial [Tanacetum coccineum]
RLMHERNPDPLALVASHQLTQPAYQSHLHTHPQSLSQHRVSPYQHSQFVTPYQHQHQQLSTNQSTPLSITYPTNEYQSTVHHNSYSQQPSIPQLEYAPNTYQQQQPEFSQPDSSLVVPVFQKGDDPIDAINHMMSFLTAVVTSRYPTTNNQLRTSSNPRQQATIYDGKVTVQWKRISHQKTENKEKMTKPGTEWKSCKGQSQSKAKDQKSQSQSQLNKLTVKTGAVIEEYYCCQLDEQWFDLSADLLRNALAITLVKPTHPFELPPTGDTVLDFVNELGYPEPIEFVSSIRTNYVYQPWRAILSLLNQCLTGKTSGSDKPRHPVLQMLWGNIPDNG